MKRETVCPAELDQDVPATPTPGDDAVVSGNVAGLAYVAALTTHVFGITKLLQDAKAACPK